MSEEISDIGLIGLAVMGQNLALNIADHGFKISDHADWNDLIKTIEESGAKEVILIHGAGPILRKYLNSKGIIVSNYTKTNKEDKSVQLSMFNE